VRSPGKRGGGPLIISSTTLRRLNPIPHAGLRTSVGLSREPPPRYRIVCALLPAQLPRLRSGLLDRTFILFVALRTVIVLSRARARPPDDAKSNHRRVHSTHRVTGSLVHNNIPGSRLSTCPERRLCRSGGRARLYIAYIHTDIFTTGLEFVIKIYGGQFYAGFLVF